MQNQHETWSEKYTTTSKNVNDGVTSLDCDVIVNSPLYRQSGGIWNPDSDTWSVILLPKKCSFFAKYAEISKIKVALVLGGIFFGTMYVRVLTHQISSF